MRAGYFAALFFSAAAVWAAPSQVQERDLADNLEKAADQLFSINIESVLSEATPVVASVLHEATAAVGSVLAKETGISQEVTSLLSEAESALGPTGTAIANELNKVISTPNGAARPHGLWAVTVIGSMLLGAYTAL